MPNPPIPSLESLRCFIVAAETLNFRAASDRVHLTPSALSLRIKQLEALTGEALFTRNTRHVRLTARGAAFLALARATLRAAEQCLQPPQADGSHALELTLGTRHELGMSWVLPAVQRLGRETGATVHLYFGSGLDLFGRLLTREIDCAITSSRLSDSRLAALALHREDYDFVACRATAKSARIASAKDAAQHALIDIDGSCPLFRYMRDAQGDIDAASFERVLGRGTIAAIRESVLAGEGVAVLPHYFVADDLKAKRLVRLLPKLPLAHDHFRLVFRVDDGRRHEFERLAVFLRGIPLR